MNTLRIYFVNNDYEINNIKMLYAYAVYNNDTKDINKWERSKYQTLKNDKNREKFKDFYKEYVIDILKTMN